MQSSQWRSSRGMLRKNPGPVVQGSSSGDAALWCSVLSLTPAPLEANDTSEEPNFISDLGKIFTNKIPINMSSPQENESEAKEWTHTTMSAETQLLNGSQGLLVSA